MAKKIQSIFALTKEGARGLLLAITSSFFVHIIYMVPLMILMYFLQASIDKKIQSPMHYVLAIAILFIIMWLLISKNYKHLYSATYKEAANLRIDIGQRLKELPVSYFYQHDLADLSQTIMKDTADIEHAMSHAIPQAISLGIFFILISIMLLVSNFRMGLAVIVPLLISLVCIFVSRKIQMKGATRHYKKLRENSDKFQEAIDMQEEIRSYNKKDEVISQIFKAIDEEEKIHINSEMKQAIPVSLSSTLLALSLGSTIFFGSYLYVNEMVSLVYFVAYIIAAARITEMMETIFMSLAELLYIDVRIKRINDLRNVSIQKGKNEKINKYNIEFEDVDFSYVDGLKVLDKASFTCEQDQVTAIIGPSGCGKTTALRLMSRLYDYDSGTIKIGGKDIKDINVEDLYDKISIVFQDVVLFNTSVLENIRIGNKGATDEEVKEAARLANCEEFVLNMPQGYDSPIGENGSRLSGGQRQRISIARAFLKDAPILLLDEISASLDVENEMYIQDSLNRLMKNKTVVIVSHRLKSIENADKIIVMEKGHVDAIGKHEDLIKESSLYASLIEKSNLTSTYLY